MKRKKLQLSLFLLLQSLQEGYGIKAVNLVKTVVTGWLSHGAACKRCRERYHIIIEALDDIISTTNNPEHLSNNVLGGCPQCDQYSVIIATIRKKGLFCDSVIS